MITLDLFGWDVCGVELFLATKSFLNVTRLPVDFNDELNFCVAYLSHISENTWRMSLNMGRSCCVSCLKFFSSFIFCLKSAADKLFSFFK